MTNRTLNVVRMQLINKQTYIWVPLLILGAAYLMSMAIYAILTGSGIPGPFYGGGAQAPLWYFGIVGIQALSLTFPFSQAMSITRREFFLGTLLTAVITAAILAVIAVVGGFIEQATNGWGLNGYFFAQPWIWDSGAISAFLFNFVAAMFIFVGGFWFATIYKRFGGLWLAVVLVAIGLLFVAGLWVVGRLDAWGSVWTWIAVQGVTGMALWGLAVTAVLAATAFLTLRRAIP